MDDPNAFNGDDPTQQETRRYVVDEDTPVSGGSRSTAPLYVQIPGYELVREIHRGGQGVVLQAVQLSTRRKVAVKVMLDGAWASLSSRRRFEREVELAARLKHPNIVAVFDSGETSDGQLFYVMDYVRGEPVGRYVRRVRPPLFRTLELFVGICDAVSYAHQRGVMHRDLKPSNILVDADGLPKVLDFGLAKQMAGPDDTQLSESGQILGTLPYMSPEQVRGNPDEVDVRTDVYALGVILYELLTGSHPYSTTGGFAEAYQNITQTEPKTLRNAWRSDLGICRREDRSTRSGRCPLDDEVQTIVRKALAKDKEWRYQSAAELARDVRRYLQGEPVEARRGAGWNWYLIRKTLRRRRTPLVIGALCLLLATAGVAATILFSRQRDALRRAELAERSMQLLKAQWSFDQGDLPTANNVLETLLTADPTDLDAGLLHVRTLRRLEKSDAAMAELDRLRTYHPDEPAVLTLAADLLKEDDPAASANLLAQADAESDASARSFYLRSLSASGDEEAVALLNKALEQDPGFFEALIARTGRYYRLQRWDLMLSDAERALSCRPDDARAWYNLGLVTFRLRKDDRARQAFEQAVKIMPEFESAWWNLGLVHERNNRLPAAEAALQQAVRLDPNRAQYWSVLGRVRSRMDQTVSARQALEKALAIDSTDWQTAYHLGVQEQRLGRFSEALAWYRRSLNLPDADRTRILISLGTALDALGEEAEALQAYQQVLNNEPNHVAALNNAAWIHLTAQNTGLRNVSKAREYALRATEIEPRQASVWGTLGLAELRAGDYAAALTHSRQAIALGAGSAWEHAQVARAACELGDLETARDARRQVAEALQQRGSSDPALRAFIEDLDQRLKELLNSAPR